MAKRRLGEPKTAGSNPAALTTTQLACAGVARKEPTPDLLTRGSLSGESICPTNRPRRVRSSRPVPHEPGSEPRRGERRSMASPSRRRGVAMHLEVSPEGANEGRWRARAAGERSPKGRGARFKPGSCGGSSPSVRTARRPLSARLRARGPGWARTPDTRPARVRLPALARLALDRLLSRLPFNHSENQPLTPLTTLRNPWV